MSEQEGGEERRKGRAGSVHDRDCRPIALLLAALAFAATCRAEMPPFYGLGERPEKDVLAAGLLYFHAPRYAGSDEQRTIVLPSGTAILANGFFADAINGVGFNFSADKRFEYGVRATLGLGRDARRGVVTMHAHAREISLRG